MAENEIPFAERALAEIDGLHRVLQAWFRGEGGDDAAKVMERFDEAFHMVGAAGNLLSHEGMAAALPRMRGSRPTLVMEIEDVTLRALSQAGALITYREVQRQDSGTTQRWSTALLVDRPDRPTPVWALLQETVIP
ncbi:DUF4440 domain-containing protein [Aureimonas populi]|uniref:DUF4440 domain-containing protein n=1 Tax=Aureimonas populi TaxID=1701758 RepID=A0ABW5CI40_9HYPH|nr:DUF4440 domain-containing protein [Aureimonas populi]